MPVAAEPSETGRGQSAPRDGDATSRKGASSPASRRRSGTTAGSGGGTVSRAARSVARRHAAGSRSTINVQVVAGVVVGEDARL